MERNISFGYWVRRRRNLLELTQADLASRINCSLSMLRKIERDERRPSVQLAELMADQLEIGLSERRLFLQMARGQYVPDIPDPATTPITILPAQPLNDKGQDESTPFVAREKELEKLHEHLELAMAGKGRMVFIAGEAGRGKTSLIVEFARQAMRRLPELLVAGGTSDVYTGLGDPLLPFRDIFRMLANDLETASMKSILSDELADRLAAALPTVTQILLDQGPHLVDTLVPSLTLETKLGRSFARDKIGTQLLVRLQERQARRASSTTQEIRQDRLFEEISTTLSTLAHRQPLLLLLDDLHWVDPSTAGLLGHLAIRLKNSKILIVGSFRPEDLIHSQPATDGLKETIHPLNTILSESQRQFGQNRIDLDHPEPGEDLEFVNALLDADENAFGLEFRKRLTQLTEGHPLFVIELLRDMREQGDIILDSNGCWQESESMSWEHFPARVEGVIEKRISRLPEQLLEILTIGSVQGETFLAEVVAHIKQINERELIHILSENLDRQHRLIRQQGILHTGTERLSQYQFHHHLIQKYVYARLSEAERMYLHEDVGQALEALYESHDSTEDMPAVQLARHFQEARLSVKASKYLYLAGQKAYQIIAFEEAATHFEQGRFLLHNLEKTPELNRLEFDITLALARAYWHGGHVAEALSACEEAIEVARTLHDPEALARAALVYEEPRWRLNLDAVASQHYMREALAALSDEDSGLRARLLVSLSRALLASGEQEGLQATVDQALRIARKLDDPVALCDALRISAQIDRRPDTTTSRLAAVEEMIALAQSIGDQERLTDAFDLYIYDHLELGHIEIVDQTIAKQKQVAEDIKQPLQLHIAAVFQTMRAIMRGEFERAELLANEAAGISRQIGLADLDGIYGIHMFSIRWEQGRLNEIAPIVKLIVANSPESASWLPGLALIFSTLDLRDECQAIFEELVSDSTDFVPQDSLRVASLAYLTEVCTYLEDSVRALTLYELLQPYDGRTVVVGGATACYGAASRYLGMLASTMSDWPSAERHFKSALELDGQIRAWPWLAHDKYEYAAMLLARGEVADYQQAIGFLDEANASARLMGMGYLTQKITNLQEDFDLA